MSFIVEESAVTSLAPDAVFAFLSEDDSWRYPAVRSVRPLQDGPPAVGSRYENKIRVAGVPSRAVHEITHLEPPHRLSWRQVDGRGLVRTLAGNYLIESAAGGSRITVRNEYQLAGPGVALGPIVRLMTRRVVRRQVARLASILS